MPSISKSAPIATLINVFTVKPGKQDELIRVLEAATHEVMKDIDGFVSASLHRSLDGKKVANYAQWRDPAAFQAMLKNPRAQEHMQKATALSESVEPSLYEVAAIVEIP